MKKVAKSLGALSLVGCAVLSSQIAWADDSGWIGGLSVGQSKARIDDPQIISQLQGAGFATTSLNDVNRDTAFKIFGGYQFNQYFALEGGYFDLGKFGYAATTSPTGGLNGSIQLNGVNVDAVGILPFEGKFSIFGRLGLNYAQSRDSFIGTGGVVTSESKANANSVNLKAGVGVQYNFIDSVALRGEWERYRINDAVGARGDIDLLSIGLVVMFGKEKPAPAPIIIIKEVPQAIKEVPQVAKREPVLVIVPLKVKTQQYCSILDIQFEIKQDDIQREMKEKLSVVGTFMKKYPDTTALIEGHTDDVGSDEFNMKLSQQRAESVVSYLMDTFHIASSRLTAVGYGTSRPIADNGTSEGRRANRRIDAVIACATDVAGLKVEPARLTMAMEMEFDVLKDDIDPRYFDELAKVAGLMKANPLITATVEGHAGRMDGDKHISPDAAMKVSQRRAQKVVDYLVDKLDVPRSHLSTAEFGQARRVAYGTTLEGQQENRRVNIIFNYNTN
jgi:OOP family OmpA-OmpF porin